MAPTFADLLGNPNSTSADFQALENQAPAQQVFGGTPQVAGQIPNTGPTAAQIAFFNSQGQLTKDQMAQQKAIFDAQLQFEREQMERLSLPQLVIQQRLADLQQQQFQFQMRQVMEQQGLAERQLGLQALTAQAQLGGPSNWVQAYNLAQGLKNTDIPVFMNRLLSGQTGPASVAGAGLSAPQSLEQLAASAGAGSPGSPAVTVNGQPVGGTTAAPGFGAGLGGVLAPLPPLSTGGGVGGSSMFNALGTGGGFTPTTSRTVPAGQSAGNIDPTYIGDRGLTQGTSNLGAAQQEVGTAPGQGGTLYSGQRGIQFLGYDPATNKVRVMFKTLRDLPIIPKFDAGPISFTQVGGPQALPGNPNGGGWEKVPYYTGAGNGLVLDYQLSGTPDQIRNQQFSATYAQPTEGGLANEALQFSGNDLFNLPNFNAQQQAAADTGGAAAPAPDQTGMPSPPTAAPFAMQTPPPDPNSPDMSGVYNIGRAIFTAGGGAFAPQALESIGPTGLDMLHSVGNAVGADWRTFIDQYTKSRIGQNAAMAA